MAKIDWIEVIRFVLELIEKGMKKDEAIEKVANKFGITKSDILKKL